LISKNTRFGAFGAEDVGTVGDETFTDQRGVARGALEAVVMPVTVFERDEPSTSDSSDRFVASGASFGEEFAEAFGTVRLFVFGSEALAGQ